MNPGFYYDIPDTEYRSWGGVSQSDLKSIEACPYKWQWLQDNPIAKPPPTSDQVLGTIMHTAVLEPHLFDEKYQPYVGTFARNHKKWQEADESARAAGKELVRQKHYDTAKLLIECGSCDLLWKDGRNGIHTEVSMAWEMDGVFCKGRADMIRQNESPPAIVDLKTCATAEPVQFARAAYDYGYHIQAAFYRAGYHALSGVWPDYRILAVEKTEPFVAVMYRVIDESLGLGIRQMEGALTLYKECSKSGKWPSYADNRTVTLELPRWAGM